jgi:FAD/FMN-containing dehydrogenase
MNDFAGLSIEGRLATPGDADWDAARAAWNLAVDQHPRAVAFVESIEDLARVVRHAGEHGLSVTAQGTGHGAASLGSLEDAVLVKTERMRGIEVDAHAGTARVEAGVLAAELGAATQAHGLCPLPGSSPDVGVVGYTLGGGLSWLGRAHGFACNAVVAIELVTAAGEVRRVDAEHDEELFWALRGGGGGYALVTALHLRLLPVADLFAGALVLPAELGTDAVRAYRDWAAGVPETVTSAVRFLRLPPMPDVPEPLRDRPLLTVSAAILGSREEGEALIAPLRELGAGGATVMDTFSQIPAAGLSRINMDPEHPVPALSHHGILRDLPDEAIDAFVATAGPDAGSPLLLAELRHAGGALSREPEGAGALAKLDATYVMLGIGAPISPEFAARIDGHLDRLSEQMRPWTSQGGYLNFAERPCDLDAILPAETCARLREVKDRWDPDDVIRANHALSIAAG